MARIGMNPSRSKTTDYRPARVTAAVLVHIPHLTGYYQDRWDVLHACLTSLVQNTQTPYDLLVFDNRSCPEVGEYLDELQSRGVIDYLLRSTRNVGKIGAFQILFRAAPGELVAYCDDDFYYETGWLQSHLEILDAFPRVGMVSGYVIPTFFVPERMSAALKFTEADAGAVLDRNVEIPDLWVEQWAESTGRDPNEALNKAADFEPVMLSYAGVRAFAAANHDQFVAPKDVILNALPKDWSDQLMGQMLAIDEAINAKGLLRLGTAERTSRHLGNKLPAELAERLKLETQSSRSINSARTRPRSRPQWLVRFLGWKPVRSVLLALYSRLFHWINLE